MELLGGFLIAQCLRGARWRVERRGLRGCVRGLRGEGLERCCGLLQMSRSVMEPGKSPCGVIAQRATRKVRRQAAVESCCLFLFSDGFVDVAGGVPRSFSIRARGVTLHDQLEVVERLSVVIAVPENLPDLIERLGRF